VSIFEPYEPAMIQFIKGIESADPAHDFAHVNRVVSLAKMVATSEGADLDIVVPAAWLHDCVAVAKDSPNRNQASRLAGEKALKFLKELGYPGDKLDAIFHAIESHSYSANVKPITLEAQIVQDADRLDALGAIGIARCMLVGGSIGRSLYSAHDPLCKARTPDDKTYTIDHFFTKLLKIGETMNTRSATREAQRRTDYMKNYLNQLLRDVNALDFDLSLAPAASSTHSP